MILYDFFKIFIESSIILIHCVSFFNSFLIIDNAKNNIKFSLKSYFNFIVSFLLFSIILWILFKSSIFVMFRKFFFRFRFRYLSSFFFLFSSLSCLLWLFFLFCFFFSFSILVIFVTAFITFAYVSTLIDWLAFCFSIVWNLFFMRFSVRTNFEEFSMSFLDQLLAFQSFSIIFSFSAQFYFSSNQRSFFWLLWLDLSFDFVCWWSDCCFFETSSIHHRSVLRTTSHRIHSMLWKSKMLSSLRLFLINGINYLISSSLCSIKTSLLSFKKVYLLNWYVENIDN